MKKTTPVTIIVIHIILSMLCPSDEAAPTINPDRGYNISLHHHTPISPKIRKAIIKNPLILLFCFLDFSSPFKILTYSLAFEIWKITRKISTTIAIKKKLFMLLFFPHPCYGFIKIFNYYFVNTL